MAHHDHPDDFDDISMTHTVGHAVRWLLGALFVIAAILGFWALVFVAVLGATGSLS